jgi:hypothetical protein
MTNLTDFKNQDDMWLQLDEAAKQKLFTQCSSKEVKFILQYSPNEHALQPVKIISYVRRCAELMEKKFKTSSENSVFFICMS